MTVPVVDTAAAPGPAGNGARWAGALASRARRARGRRTLAALLDAALEELTAYGYHGARVSRVTQRAGTSHGTFYLYFRSKNDLLLAVYDDLAVATDAVLGAMPALVAGPEGMALLREWVAAVCRKLQDDGVVRTALLDALNDGADPHVATVAMGWMNRATACWAGRIAASGARDIDPELAAICIYNLVDGANRSLSRGELVVTEDELVDGLAEFIHRSVLGP